MEKRIITLVIIGLLILKGTNGYATTVPVKPDYQRNHTEFERLHKSAPDSVLLKGEIIDINHHEVVVNPYNEKDDVYRLKLVRDTKFYCNGIGSEWEALIPVAPEAYFEARIIINGQTEVIAVNAFYYGEECIVGKFFQNQGKSIIELISALSEEVFVAQVNQNARLPKGENWKQEGQIVYILFNEEEEIRAVFLPD